MLMSHDRFKEILELVDDAVEVAVSVIDDDNDERNWAQAWSDLREFARMNWPRY